MLLIGDITFPRWNGDDQFDPYITEKQLDDALNHGKSLDAAERTAGANEFLSVNSDANITGKLLLKAVDKRRADVVRFMVERGADLGVITHKTLAPGETLLVDTNSLVSWEDSVEFDVRTTGGCCTCCCAGEGLFNTKLTGPGEVFLQSYSHGKFKNYAIEWYLGNRASAGLARFASRGGAAADPFGAPPAADTEVIQRRGNNAPAPVPAAAPMDRKGR